MGAEHLLLEAAYFGTVSLLLLRLVKLIAIQIAALRR